MFTRSNVTLSWSGISYGSEYRQSIALKHSVKLRELRDRLFVSNPANENVSISINLDYAGTFSCNLTSMIGMPKFKRKAKEFEIPVQIGLADFNHGDEDKFRKFFAAHLTKAIERVISHKDCEKIGIDPVLLLETWQRVIDEYMALELPLPAFVAPESSEPPLPTNAEYFFEFAKKKDVLAFSKALKSRGLGAEWDDESDSGYYVVVEDPDSREWNEALEKELVALAVQFGGEYDGWAAE